MSLMNVQVITQADHFDWLAETASMARSWAGELRVIPIIGGDVNRAGFSLASGMLKSQGLHRVAYLVINIETHATIAFSDTREAALQRAREVVSTVGVVRLRSLLERLKKAQQPPVIDRPAYVGVVAHRARKAMVADGTPRVPKRRKRIFDESAGRCHYCATPLTLDGKWHIEHKMPIALMGTDDPGNLVAACVPCNLRKHDRTEAEFIADESVPVYDSPFTATERVKLPVSLAGSL